MGSRAVMHTQAATRWGASRHPTPSTPSIQNPHSPTQRWASKGILSPRSEDRGPETHTAHARRVQKGTLSLPKPTTRDPPGRCMRACRRALDVGYRHIDCASLYENEDMVGRELAEWVAAAPGAHKREDVYMVSKVFNGGCPRAPASLFVWGGWVGVEAAARATKHGDMCVVASEV